MGFGSVLGNATVKSETNQPAGAKRQNTNRRLEREDLHGAGKI